MILCMKLNNILYAITAFTLSFNAFVHIINTCTIYSPFIFVISFNFSINKLFILSPCTLHFNIHPIKKPIALTTSSLLLLDCDKLQINSISFSLMLVVSICSYIKHNIVCRCSCENKCDSSLRMFIMVNLPSKSPFCVPDRININSSGERKLRSSITAIMSVDLAMI